MANVLMSSWGHLVRRDISQLETISIPNLWRKTIPHMGEHLRVVVKALTILEGVYRLDRSQFITTPTADQIEGFDSLTLTTLACSTAPGHLQLTAEVLAAP